MSTSKRILIIANKTWEAEPLINALLNPEFKPKELIIPQTINFPRQYGQLQYLPRLVYEFSDQNVRAEVWCLQDLMDSSQHPSSSAEKHKCLHLAFDYLNQPPDLVVAFGTAAYLMPPGTPGNQSNNGCVVIGSHAFLHNGNPNGQNPDSVWDDPADFEKLQNSALSPDFWALLDATFISSVSHLLLSPPLNPAPTIRPLNNPDFIALNTINVTNSAQYATKDQESIDALAKSGNTLPIGSIETTHGIIRIQSQAPFLFISGIVNREGYFGTDVVPHLAAQNFTGAFNAGITTAWLLPIFVSFLSAEDKD